MFNPIRFASNLISFYTERGYCLAREIPVYGHRISTDDWPIRERIQITINMGDPGVHQFLIHADNSPLKILFQPVGWLAPVVYKLYDAHVCSVQYITTDFNPTESPDVNVEIVYSERWIMVGDNEFPVPMSVVTGLSHSARQKKPPSPKKKAALWYRDGF